MQDRLILQALHQQLSPLWEADFSEHSYGFHANRSAHEAVRSAQGFTQAGKRWVVDIDLKDFFDEVLSRDGKTGAGNMLAKSLH